MISETLEREMNKTLLKVLYYVTNVSTLYHLRYYSKNLNCFTIIFRYQTNVPLAKTMNKNML